jgi:2-dehydrotetronate isomerase
MPKFAANLSMMYNEVPFLDRFAQAAEDGFKAVEFLFPYEHSPQDIAAHLQAHGLAQALFNMPPGNWAAGERGVASLPGREDDFKRGVEQALPYLEALGNQRVHVMAGLIQPGQDRARHREVYLRNLAYAAQAVRELGVTVVIEPINTRDIPGFFLNTQAEAHAVCDEVGASNLKVQFDLYHCQIVEGDLAMTLRKHFAGIGHMQIAGVPERHEPDLGEIHYPYLFKLIDELGYSGYVGCEYRPRAGTRAGLGWFAPYRDTQ